MCCNRRVCLCVLVLHTGKRWFIICPVAETTSNGEDHVTAKGLYSISILVLKVYAYAGVLSIMIVTRQNLNGQRSGICSTLICTPKQTQMLGWFGYYINA